MKRIILIIVLFFPFLLKAQTLQYNLPPKLHYNRANITLKDFTKFEGKKLQIMSDSVCFLNARANINQCVVLSSVEYFRVQEGTQALKWCGYGALFMGLSAVIGVMNEPTYPKPGAFIVGFTLSGAAIGGLIGLAIPRWRTYYVGN
jgi:hypothetical protein